MLLLLLSKKKTSMVLALAAVVFASAPYYAAHGADDTLSGFGVYLHNQRIPNDGTSGGPDSAPVISEIFVHADLVLCDLDLVVDITHPRASDLEVRLKFIPNQGNTITALITDNDCGALGANLIQTFDDQADQGLTRYCVDGGPRLRPREPGALAKFNGHSMEGTWQLVIKDTLAGVTGFLNEWTLLVTECIDGNVPFTKKYSDRWPHCTNIGACPITSRSDLENRCRNNNECTGYSYSNENDQNDFGGDWGCLKRCTPNEFGGFGIGGHDYWARST